MQKQLILKKDMDFSDVVKENCTYTLYWVFNVSYHDWEISSFDDEPLTWWFKSKSALIESYNDWDNKNPDILDYFEVAEAVRKYNSFNSYLWKKWN